MKDFEKRIDQILFYESIGLVVPFLDSDLNYCYNHCYNCEIGKIHSLLCPMKDKIK